MSHAIDQVETRLSELAAKHQVLVEQQGVVERELVQLRTDDVLGRLDEAGALRKDGLLDQANQISADVREVMRLRKVSNQALTKLKGEAYLDAARTERELALETRDLARLHLPEITHNLEEAAAHYLATYGLANLESPTASAKVDRAKDAINRKKLLVRVEEIMTEFRENCSG